MCNKTKNKTFEDILVYNFLAVRVLEGHKKVSLKRAGKQSVKLRSGSINFKNYLKQIAALFQIYADFESVLKEV